MNPMGWNILEPSPFHLLQKHALAVQSVMEGLIEIFKYKMLSNESLTLKAYQDAVEHEHKADILKRKLRTFLNENVFLPVSRRDLLEVILLQDSIANKIKDVAGLFFSRNMKVLPVWVGTWETFVQTLELSVRLVVQLNEDLVHMLEAGFHSRMQQVLLDTVEQLDVCESEHDDLLVVLRRSLYEVEKDMSPIDVWFYYQLLERMGHVTDIARRLGFQLVTLVTR